MAELPGAGTHPVVIVTRSAAIPALGAVVCAMVTSTVRGIPSEAPIGRESGLDHDSVVNCDNLHTIRRRRLSRQVGALGTEQLGALDSALRIALGLDDLRQPRVTRPS